MKYNLNAFIATVFLFCSIFWSVSANAQEILAAIVAADLPRYQEVHESMIKVLQTGGFGEDKLKIFKQNPNADKMSLTNSLRRAEAAGATMVITYGSQATSLAKESLKDTPLLFADVYDPVALNLVSAEKMTGHNMTGVRGDAPLQTLMKYFLEATEANTLAVLYDDTSPEANLQKIVLHDYAVKRGADVILFPVSDFKDHEASLQNMPEGVDGLFLADSELNKSYFERVIGVADEHQIPVFTQRAGAAKIGAFMVLQTSAVEQGEKVSEMAKAILAGKKVEEIQMYKPRKVEFVVNLKVANRYNLNVPFQTLSVASSVVR